jgi:hypothetical protein
MRVGNGQNSFRIVSSGVLVELAILNIRVILQEGEKSFIKYQRKECNLVICKTYI